MPPQPGILSGGRAPDGGIEPSRQSALQLRRGLSHAADAPRLRGGLRVIVGGCNDRAARRGRGADQSSAPVYQSAVDETPRVAGRDGAVVHGPDQSADIRTGTGATAGESIGDRDARGIAHQPAGITAEAADADGARGKAGGNGAVLRVSDKPANGTAVVEAGDGARGVGIGDCGAVGMA